MEVDLSSGEAAQLELLERVFLRLGSASTDEQLQATLERFLLPTILKSASEFKSVQSKVLEILTHVNRRLQSRPGVLLPVGTLLLQLNSEQATPQISNFSLVYIKLGFQRLSAEKQASLLPNLIHSLHSRTPQQQHSLLKLFILALVHFKFSKDISKRKEVFALDDKPQVKSLLLDFLQSYLLLPYGQLESGTSPAFRAPAGLSWNRLEQLLGKDKEPVKPEEMEKVKMAILRFLGSEIFSANDCVTPFLVAAADPKHGVADEGDHLLKQFGSSGDFDDPSLVSRLYALYLGTVVAPGSKRPHAGGPPGDGLREHRSPAALRLRLRLMPYLTKSTLAANSFPAAIQVIFDNLFGVVSNSKLKIQSLHFIRHICSRASDQKLNVMSPVLLTGLNKLINQPQEDSKLHVLSYVAIGSLAKRMPNLFIKDTRHLSRILNKFQKDLPQDVSLSIQECLSLMSAAYRGVKGQSATIVEALILEYIYSEVVGARLTAVHYAVSVFPFHHVPSRFACMLACGDRKGEVRDEGRKGLVPPTADNVAGWSEKDRALPDFCQMLQYLHKRAGLAKKAGAVYRTVAGQLPFHPFVLTEGLGFLRACLAASAGVSPQHTLQGTTLPLLLHYLATVTTETTTICQNYLELLRDSLVPAGDGDLHGVAMAALLELTAAAPSESVRAHLVPDILWVKGFTHSSRAETREAAARLVGLLSWGLDSAQGFLEFAEQVFKDTFDPSYGVQHGGVVSLGHLAAVLVDPQAQQAPAGALGKATTVDYITRATQRLVDIAKGSNTQLASSACKALGTIFCSGPLPLPSGRAGGLGKEEEMKEEEEKGVITKATIVESLAGIISSAKQQKLKEHCVLSLGNLSLGEAGFPLKEAVMAALLQLKEEKGLELQFSVGEAMACTLAGGFISTLTRDPWRLATPTTGDSSSKDDSSGVTFDPEAMSRGLEDILRNYAVGTSPIVRQSSCVWLLSLLKHGGKHPGIQSQLKNIQMVFMDMLTEHSEVTQEVASRGMGLVYDMSEGAGRQELVQMLVGTLVEGRKSSMKVTDDTKLFQEGFLGKAPKGSGGSLSTYKELCSLASDMNKPDLVYKFMSLANHSAIWNSKKGAAYGFSTIASQAQEQLAPHLATVVPRLYRYKYDPNPGVQGAMSNIWAAVVPDSKRAVERYLSQIMADLLSNLNSPLWRNRQSSCMALSDLLVGRQVGEVADELPQLWELLLRVRDDVKETVRKAADIACESLHKVTVRACDGVTMTTTGVKVVEGVLPILLKNGLTNPSDDIKAISLRSVLKISKNAGVLLKPHVATLIPSLLESLSSLESQKLNMYSLMLTSEAEVQEQLDSLRVAASRSSPMMETVRLCVDQVGAEQLPSLVPRLAEVMKSGVGLATKVASAQLVVHLVQHCLHDLTPFAGKLMNALLTGLSDRNSAVRRANAKAIGHLVRVSKDTTVTKTIAKLQSRYFEEEDGSVLQESAAFVFHAMARHSLDAAKNFSSEFLPLVFLAMHRDAGKDQEKVSVRSKWEETWEELVPGKLAGVKLYLPELAEMACSRLLSQSWAVKKQAAAAIATITQTMGGQLRPPHLPRLLLALLDGLQSRTWDGKTKLLQALSTLCKSCAETLISAANTKEGDQPTPPAKTSTQGAPQTAVDVKQVASAVMAQCKKKDLAYKTAALECLGGVAEALKVEGIFASIYNDIISPVLSPGQAEGGDSDEEEDRRISSTAKLELKVKTLTLIGQTWPADITVQGEYYGKVMELLSSSLPMNNWKTQVAILSSMAAIYEKLNYIPSEEEFEYQNRVSVPALAQCIGEVKYSAVRSKALLATQNMVAHHKRGAVAWSGLSTEATATLARALESMRDDQLKDKAIAILKTLNS